MDQLGLYQDLDNIEYNRFLDQRDWDYKMQQAALAAMGSGGYGGGTGGSGGSYSSTASTPSPSKKRDNGGNDDDPVEENNPYSGVDTTTIDDIVAGVWYQRGSDSAGAGLAGTQNARVVLNEVNDIMRSQGIKDELSQQYAIDQVKAIGEYFASDEGKRDVTAAKINQKKYTTDRTSIW